MAVSNYSDLRKHAGHTVKIVIYGNEVGVAIECLDCNEVLLDFDFNDLDLPEFMPVTGTAIMKDGGEKIIIKSASKDGRWYVDNRDGLYSLAELKYIRTTLNVIRREVQEC